jgi:RHS repeat-associated protein
VSQVRGETYVYDESGRRVAKTNGTDGTIYWNSAAGVLMETDLKGNPLREYVFLDGIRVAVITNGSGGTVAYYLGDFLGSAAVVADSSGNLLNESDYTPHGRERVIQAKLADDNKYAGMEQDAETDLLDFGARYKDSGYGRFLTPDWSFAPVAVPFAHDGNPQSLNLYAYAANNPTSSRDPDGHDDPYYSSSGAQTSHSDTLSWHPEWDDAEIDTTTRVSVRLFNRGVVDDPGTAAPEDEDDSHVPVPPGLARFLNRQHHDDEYLRQLNETIKGNAVLRGMLYMGAAEMAVTQALSVKAGVGGGLGSEVHLAKIAKIEAKVQATAYVQCDTDDRCVTGLELEGGVGAKVGKSGVGASAGIQQELTDPEEGASRWENPDSMRASAKLKGELEIAGVKHEAELKTKYGEERDEDETELSAKGCLGVGCLTVKFDPKKFGETWDELTDDLYERPKKVEQGIWIY